MTWLACVETCQEGLFVIKSAKKPVEKVEPLKKKPRQTVF